MLRSDIWLHLVCRMWGRGAVSPPQLSTFQIGFRKKHISAPYWDAKRSGSPLCRRAVKSWLHLLGTADSRSGASKHARRVCQCSVWTTCSPFCKYGVQLWSVQDTEFISCPEWGQETSHVLEHAAFNHALFVSWKLKCLRWTSGNFILTYTFLFL